MEVQRLIMSLILMSLWSLLLFLVMGLVNEQNYVCELARDKTHSTSRRKFSSFSCAHWDANSTA